MSASNIHQLRLVMQGHQEGGKSMEGISLSVLINGLITDYGNFRQGRMWVDSDRLTSTEKKLILSYFVDVDDYEYATLNNARLEALYIEHQSEIQSRIDEKCDHIYYDMMRSNGAKPVRHRDNGEITWGIR